MTLTASQIRQHRKARKWTQAQLAREAGVSTRMIQDAESGKHTPQPENLRAIQRALEVDGDGDETRASWPADVQIFLDIMGAALSTLPEDQRAEKMRGIFATFLPSR